MLYYFPFRVTYFPFRCKNARYFAKCAHFRGHQRGAVAEVEFDRHIRTTFEALEALYFQKSKGKSLSVDMKATGPRNVNATCMGLDAKEMPTAGIGSTDGLALCSLSASASCLALELSFFSSVSVYKRTHRQILVVFMNGHRVNIAIVRKEIGMMQHRLAL